MDVQQNATHPFKIFMADAAAPMSGKTGLSSITAYLSKSGVAESTVSPTIVERGHGWYEVTPIAAHRDTLGESAWTFIAAGAVDFPRLETVVAVDARTARYGAAAAGDAMALTASERTTFAGVLEAAMLNEADGRALLAGMTAQLQSIFDQSGDVPVTTLVNLITAGVWTNATRTLSGNVTVGGYAAGQDPSALLATTVAKVSTIDGILAALTEVVSAVTRFRSSAMTQSPSGSGGLTTEQAAQVTRIETQTAKLSGAPVTVHGNVRPGGQIVLKHGDDHTVGLGNPVTVGVSDIGGALHTQLVAVGVGNLQVAAIRGTDTASRILGTVAALAYASDVLSVTLEFAASETGKGVVGPLYDYDVLKTATPTRTYFSGKLSLIRDARA